MVIAWLEKLVKKGQEIFPFFFYFHNSFFEVDMIRPGGLVVVVH